MHTCAGSPARCQSTVRSSPDWWSACAPPSGIAAPTRAGASRTDGVAIGVAAARGDRRRGRRPADFQRGHSVVVVCNGEIYNYRRTAARAGAPRAPLCDRLGHRGDRPPLRGARRGLRERLRGMFAFALWDRTREQRCCSRAIVSARSRSSTRRAGAALVRLRAASDPRRSAGSPRHRPTRNRSVPSLPVGAVAAKRIRGDRKAPSRPRPDVARGDRIHRSVLEAVAIAIVRLRPRRRKPAG